MRLPLIWPGNAAFLGCLGHPLRVFCWTISLNSSEPFTPVLWLQLSGTIFESQQVMGPARAGFCSERSRDRDSPRLRPRRGTEEFAGETIPSRGSDEPGPEELWGEC